MLLHNAKRCDNILLLHSAILERSGKMVNTLKLKGKMAELGYNQKDVAKQLGISPATVSQKLNNVRPMTLLEANTLSEFLEIEDKDFKEYFFVEKIAQRNKIIIPPTLHTSTK